MEKPDIRKLVYYFEEAKKYKEEIKNDYNEVFELTDINFKIRDETTRQRLTTRKVDSTVLECIRFLSNFIMTSVFSKTECWARLKSNIDVIKNITDTDTQGAEMLVNEIDEVLEKNSESVFWTNERTNYYTETNKALVDCIKVGTGIRKVVELNSTAKPFTYAYQNLDNIFFLEDNQGKPNIIFKKYIEKNLQDLKDMFGHLSMKIPTELNDENDLDKKITVIESIIGEFDEAKSITSYYHFIHTEDFAEELVFEVLDYNPYTVFRWQVDNSNPWGIGIARANKHLIKELNDNVAKRAEHRDKIVNPPIQFFGNRDLISKITLKPSGVNYGGHFNDSNKVGIQPINTGTNLIPIDQDINDCRDRLRRAFMAQPLGDVSTTANRSATEMSLRHEMFRKEFSGTYENINTELLEPTFMNAYYILEKKGLLEDVENQDYVTHSQIHYVNELTQNSGRDEALRILDFYNIVSQLVTEEEKSLIMKSEKLVNHIREKMRIPVSIVNNEEEMTTKLENQRRLQEIQLLARAQEDIGKRQETGIPGRVKEGVEMLNES
jgi:hypothetical protein